MVNDADLMCVVFRIIFWGCDSRLPGIQNRIGVLFMICVFFSLTSMSALPVFVAERAMFVREHQSGTPPHVYFFLTLLFIVSISRRVLF